MVGNKPDDYGNCNKEIVRTTAKNAKQYAFAIEVPEEEVYVLKKYMDYTNYLDEKQRSDEERYYGHE